MLYIEKFFFLIYEPYRRTNVNVMKKKKKKKYVINSAAKNKENFILRTEEEIYER